ncbi:DOPA 4,5-dioxygenase family protein [Thalassomonas actiniarum]|uniref:DOPA 4,5-dioxygenase family protein n=1 Tax=Thalassomonas actiniarum TaxID=485447 RepID=A0AAE9YVH4_9GAMM|nr:DOPA 4,5-dioxygenase family protein [Thalassomonas actiniarum]WDE01593.1 DOPA 4,5-dioxygenase family protein [Thalassomonas actiniarum]
MNNPKRPVNIHQAYHAHVYFEQETLHQAIRLCEQASKRFALKIGRVNQKPVGPHPKWSCQISFNDKDFDALIPWLDANRQQLTVLVHAVTGDDLRDHTEYVYWLGESIALDLSCFQDPA